MKLLFNGPFACALLFAGVFFTGCTSPSPDAVFSSDPSQPPPTMTNTYQTPDYAFARFSKGDTLDVTLSDAGPDITFPPYEETIKEDGTITMSLVGSIQAAGKTAGELQKAIHDLYVPKFYRRLTVTVKSSSDRVYYVSGEVHGPGRLAYIGGTTVTKAITAAGGLTDFANPKRVWLIRSTGQRIRVYYDKALKDPTQDPIVYPDDQINVERKWW